MNTWSLIFNFLSIIIICVLVPACSGQEKGEDVDKFAFTNALIDESSPYLLQHAHNPVNWYPWKEEALQKAKKEDKLLIISVGYAACHWCHVMEHESFEDTTVANFMNAHFISIKVDREERPDVDDIYMSACQLSSKNSCGWPLNVVALPDGRPFFAGTYFPKSQWLEMLREIQKLYSSSPEQVEQFANALTSGIREQSVMLKNQKEAAFPTSLFLELGSEFASKIDLKKGGPKTSVNQQSIKFPMPNSYQFLLRYLYVSSDPVAEKGIRATLDNIADGGIYDHLGGGFARYSTDADWKVPHFEKMLYDNAQLVSLYAEAYKYFKDPSYLEIVEETLDFINKEMTSPEGGFYSSFDADSEGEEGKYYVWTKSEIDSLLGDDADLFNTFYSVRDKGNWENQKNIFHRLIPEDKILKSFELTASGLDSILERSKDILLATRKKRVAPGLDDKQLSAWNALMIQGYLDAYHATANPEYLQAALKNALFLKKHMLQQDFSLLRNYKDGKAVISAFLDDYALVASAWISMYQATFNEEWLTLAEQLMDFAHTHFYNQESGMYFFTSDLDEPLISRKMEIYDNVIPGSNSVMARNWFYLGYFLYKKDYLERAETMLNNVKVALEESGEAGFLSNWLQLYFQFSYPVYEVAIVGSDWKSKRDEMGNSFLPDVLFLGGADEGSMELLKGKFSEGKTLIYVCRNKTCKFPVEDSAEAIKLLKKKNG